MKPLQTIACVYASTTGFAAAAGAHPYAICVLSIAGLAHAAITSYYGLRLARGPSQQEPEQSHDSAP